jgi:hypothetical protein
MKKIAKPAKPVIGIAERGRVAQWSKEQLDKLSTLELRALLANAERLQETEVAVLCGELLDARPRGRPAARRMMPKGVARRLVTRRKAFEMLGVSLRNRIWSRGGIRTDGAVVLTVRVDEVQEAGGAKTCLLWGPNVADSRPWSDSVGGKERLEHCNLALERGAAEGLLTYGKRAAGTPGAHGTHADRLDPETVLALRVEKRDEEYWATWTPSKRVVVNTFE